MLQPTDTPASQSTARRWTFFRRLGLLLRTRFDEDGTTLSFHEIAQRTNGRLSADSIAHLIAENPNTQPDPVTYVLLAQVFDVDPDYFVTEDAVSDYISAIQQRYAELDRPLVNAEISLQLQAYAVAMSEAQVSASV